MKIPIPLEWRTKVAGVLAHALPGTILLTIRAEKNWRNLDSAHQIAGLYALLAEELSVPTAIYGKKETGMDDEGECYSFTFQYFPPSAAGEIPLYTKLSLLPDGQVVIIYSAHT